MNLKRSLAHMGPKNAMWGKKRPQYIHDALLKANLGSKHSEEHKRKIALSATGRKHTKEDLIKMSLAQKGEKGSNWQGGKSEQTKIIKRSLEYRLWRESVFTRDDYTCVWCGARNGNGKYIELHPDHIKPFALFPELRFSIDNGRTLCIDCHKTTETYGGKMKKGNHYE